jgi:peptidoglycan/LPS O-acetylase OafA/YrhL
MDDTAVPDDSVLPAMRVVAVVVVLVLLPALVILWGLPARTADLWAWTIKPDLTPIFMGAGYGAGAYFFVRVHRARRWHEVSVGVLSAAVFALLALVATLVHFDKFNHGDAPPLAAIAFYGWTGVYIVSPFVVGWLWWRNQRLDPGVPDDDDALVGPAVRLAARGLAVAALLTAAVVLLSSSVAIDSWGWNLTPLTARVLACFTAQVGTGFLLLSFEQRWSSWRVLVQTFLVAVALLLAGAARAWDDFDHASPLTWGYLAALVGAGVSLLALYRAMERPVGAVSR